MSTQNHELQLQAAGPLLRPECTPRVLLLGETASPQTDQPYSERSFWDVIRPPLALGVSLSYVSLAQALCEKGVVVWDVLSNVHVKGAPKPPVNQQRPNHLQEFVTQHPSIDRICFMSQGAFRTFQRHFPAGTLSVSDFVVLPSTKPVTNATIHAWVEALWERPPDEGKNAAAPTKVGHTPTTAPSAKPKPKAKSSNSKPTSPGKLVNANMATQPSCAGPSSSSTSSSQASASNAAPGSMGVGMPLVDSDSVPVRFPGGGSFCEISCDLFTRRESLCHCVSQDLAMSAGIAVRFVELFGRVEELRAQNPTVGGVCVLSYEHGFVYYLITKVRYSHKPTYESFTASLQAMASHMVAHGVGSLSMPQIGCGLDGLEWTKVKRIIADVFANTNIQITACIFKPPPQHRKLHRK